MGIADATEKHNKDAVKALNTPILYSTDHALQIFSRSDCYWHFRSHLTPDKPRLRAPDEENIDHSSSEFPANSVAEPIGVLIEYCCSDTSILCDERFEVVDGQRIILTRLTWEHGMSSKEGLDSFIDIDTYQCSSGAQSHALAALPLSAGTNTDLDTMPGCKNTTVYS